MRLGRAFSAWDQNRRANTWAEVRTFSVAVHQELRDLHSRCTERGTELLGEKRGINASGAARLAAMIGTPLRVTRLAKELAQAYVRWPPCLRSSCWLAPVDPEAPACKEYLVKGLSAKVVGLWKARYGSALTILRLEHMFDDLGRAASTLATTTGMPPPTAPWQRKGLAELHARGGCFHACKTDKANQSHLLHRMNAATERKLVAFYADDQAALRQLQPDLRWPRFDAHLASRGTGLVRPLAAEDERG